MPVQIDSSLRIGGSGAPAVMSDDEIVRRILDGDLASFELLMRRYNQRLFRIVRSMLKNEHEAEDVLQETYVRAFEHLASFAARSTFSTWLTRIAIYEASARRKKNHRLTTTDALENIAVDRHGPNGESEASMGELRNMLASAIDGLPDELRTVFVMRVVEELDTAHTAECLELSEANVKVRLHRARGMLQARIDQRIGVEARRLYQFDGARCDRIVANVMARLSRA